MENKKICAICEKRIEKTPVLMPALVYGDAYVYVCYTTDLKCVTAYRRQLEKSRGGAPLSTEAVVGRLTDKGLLPLSVGVVDMAALEDLTETEREVLTRIVQNHALNTQTYLAVLEYDRRQQWPTEL